MPVVTINGQVGSGSSNIGSEVARLLGAEYVDQLILIEAAQRLGATVEAVAQKDQRLSKTGEKISRFFQNFLEKSAAAGSAGDPFLGPAGIEVILSRPYPEVTKPPITKAQELDDQRLLNVMQAIIHDVAKSGNVVIMGRASNRLLADIPAAIHFNLVASFESRVKFIMQRDNIDPAAAEKFLRAFESNRLAYFKKFYKVDANDPQCYHMVINTDRIPHLVVAKTIAEVARLLSSPTAS
jgi:cytidylate kinase